MRALAFFVMFLFLCVPVQAQDMIKVLIMEDDTSHTPEVEEKLTKLDDINGTFVKGMASYTGNLEVWRGSKGLYIINELPLEEYVEGVVKAETGSDWVLEALKAQAVVVRTYVLYQKLRNQGKKYHVTSSVLHQLYRGNNTDSLVDYAVKQTEGQILTYDGMPILAYYHSTSGERTELPEEVFGESLPYLASVSTECTLSPLCMWARRIPVSEIEKATNTRKISEMLIASRTATGRVREVKIVSNPKTLIIPAKDLRRMLGWRRLPSTDFTFAFEGNTVAFEGRGYGHGVGLSQWSALEMALEGKDYREIVSHFYPGTKIERYEDTGL